MRYRNCPCARFWDPNYHRYSSFLTYQLSLSQSHDCYCSFSWEKDTAWHHFAMYMEGKLYQVTWGDPHLLHADSLLVSHMTQCWVHFCFHSIPAFSVRYCFPHVLCLSHTWVSDLISACWVGWQCWILETKNLGDVCNTRNNVVSWMVMCNIKTHLQYGHGCKALLCWRTSMRSLNAKIGKNVCIWFDTHRFLQILNSYTLQWYQKHLII